MPTCDKQLIKIDPAVVREKIATGQGINLKELAVHIGINYSKARTWARLPKFPSLDGVIFYADFELWRRDRLGLGSSPQASPRPRAVNAGRSGAPLRKHD